VDVRVAWNRNATLTLLDLSQVNIFT
jgi:hypothetical protein